MDCWYFGPSLDQVCLSERLQPAVLKLGLVEALLRLGADRHLRQRCGAQDQYPVDGLAKAHLLDEQASHDGLARTGVIGQQEPEPGLRQHPQIDGLNPVRQRADAGQADGEVAVVRIPLLKPFQSHRT
jgi:hypothetical protein